MVMEQIVKRDAQTHIIASMTLHIFVSNHLRVMFQTVTAQAVKLLALTLASATTKAHLSASLLIWVTSLIWTGLFVKTHSVLIRKNVITTMSVRFLEQAIYQMGMEQLVLLTAELIDVSKLAFTVRLQSKDKLLTGTDLLV
jgi:hypothetical protein